MKTLELKPSEHPDYVKVHCWLRRKYGKANKCEGQYCNKKSNSYHWALKKGFEYSKDRECFIQLCHSCHKIYDMTESIRARMSEAKKGSKHAKAKLNESDIIEIRNTIIQYGDRRKLAKIYNVSESTIGLILKNKTWKHV